MKDIEYTVKDLPPSEKLHLKSRILLPLIMVTIVLSVMLTSNIYRIEYNHIRQEVINIQRNMQQVYTFFIEKQTGELVGLLRTILRDKQLLEALKTRDRQALLDQARPLFEQLKSQSRITHFYFHDPDRVNIMRIHLPNQFGDLVNRDTLVTAESTGVIVSGVELGPFGTFTLRVVAPWYDKGVLVGYVEIGMSLIEMIGTFKKMFEVETYMLVSKDYLVQGRWEAIMKKLGREANWDLLPDYVQIAGPSKPMPRDLIDVLSLEPSDFADQDVSIRRHSYITGEIALRDFGKREVGKFVMLVDITKRLDDLDKAIYKMAALAVVINGVLFIVFFVILHKAERLFVEYHHRIVDEGQTREKMQQEHIKELEYMALYDPLTDLPNRLLLQDRIKHAIDSAKRENQPLALTVLNLNRLREINNTLGHQAGDAVLKQIATRLQQSVRGSDTVARLGGDEFAVLMPMVNVTLSQLAVEKLQSLLEATFDIEGIPVSITANFGIAIYPDDSHDVYNLIRHADVAMRDARRLHRGIVVYDAEHDPYNLRKLKLFSDLKSAFQNKELFLEYQPQINRSNQKIIAVEALVRWRHPTEGLIPPDEFIPLLENTALIKTLTSTVLEEALYQCSEWNKNGIDMRVAINVSMFDLYTTDIAEQISDLLQHYGLKTTSLMLEITESVIMEDPDATIKLLMKLNDMNIKLSIDDFGTGYSSLAYLQQLPVSELKIDRSFICEMTKNIGDEVIVRSTIQLAHNLGLDVVAEGVDDKATWNKLGSMGCDIIQGHYISPPLPVHKFNSWMKDSSSLEHVT